MSHGTGHGTGQPPTLRVVHQAEALLSAAREMFADEEGACACRARDFRPSSVRFPKAAKGATPAPKPDPARPGDAAAEKPPPPKTLSRSDPASVRRPHTLRGRG